MKDLVVKLTLDQMTALAVIYKEIEVKCPYFLVDFDTWGSLFGDKEAEDFVIKANDWTVKRDEVLQLVAITSNGNPDTALNSQAVLNRVRGGLKKVVKP